MYLFSINRKGAAILHKDVIKICPEFAQLREDELLFIILSVDYYSPFRQLSEDERIRRAKLQVYGMVDVNPMDSIKIQEAARLYQSLQYDPIVEQRRTYQQKIDTINDAIRESDNPEAINKLIKTNKELRKELEAMDKELLMNEEEESINLFGKGSLSFLEKLLRNKEKYEEVVKYRGNMKSPSKEVNNPLTSMIDEV